METTARSNKRHERATLPAIASPVGPITARLASMDALRGLVMLLMMGEALRLGTVAQALPESAFWSFLGFHQAHVEWVGCSLHDLIQPVFSFLVGVAVPFSLASRMARGDSRTKVLAHALWRAFALILLGVFLRSIRQGTTNWIFTDTLAQIGLGYFFLVALGLGTRRLQWFAFAAILPIYWAAFALWPLPGPDFDFSKVGVSSEWLAAHGLTGFAAHWQKNSNLGWAFDAWFLNLFSREKPFLFNPGGYATLSFIPTLGTMILGLCAGNVLRSERTTSAKLRWLVVAGTAGLVGGMVLGWLGICPVVKRLWTPSWTLYSGGCCLLLLAGFYWVIDMKGHRRWAYALIVVGMNSIAAYCIDHLCGAFIEKSLKTHLGIGAFGVFGTAFQPALLGAATVAIMWLMLWWMHRRKLFLKI